MRPLRPALAALVFGLAAPPAHAHPHVWVTARSEVVYAADGKVTAIRHAWTFDDAYSSVAVQGLDTNGDGKYSREELAELAKVNTESLSEFDYFTASKIDGRKQQFGAPVDEWLEHDGKVLTLHFTLPLKSATRSTRYMSLDVYDPTFFVAFSYADVASPVTLASAPAGCAVQMTRPKPPEPELQAKLTESFFTGLAPDGDFGARMSTKVIVACP